MFFRRFLVLATAVIYLQPLMATWKCRGALSDEARILFTVDELGDGFWIPKAHEMAGYQKFRSQLPAELQNASRLTELAKRSESFRKALFIFESSLNAASTLKPDDSPTVIVNHLMKVLFNEDRPRIAAATGIAKLIRDTEIAVASKFSADEFKLFQEEQKLALHAKALNQALEKTWNDSADTDLVYGWITADRSPEIEAQIWGNPPAVAENILTGLTNAQRDVQKLIEKHRQEPLIKSGEIYRDKFRAALVDFEAESLQVLRAKYKALFSLKDHGAMDKVSDLLSPYTRPIEGVEPSEIYFSRSLDVLKRLFASAHFFKEFQEFQQAYVDACNTLLELSKDTQLTMLERRKLSTIAEEYLMSYSIDLINFGLNYKPPHEYRYRPLLLQMQLLNGQLTREVIPVGMLINLSPSDDGAGPSPLIIKP